VLILTVLALPCLVAPGALRQSPDRCASLLPRPPVSHARLAANVDRIVTAPRGTTYAFHVGERELEAYLNEEALPLAGFGAARMGLRLHSGRAEAAVLLTSTRCFAILELHQQGEQGAPTVALKYAKLGPIEVPATVRDLMSRVLNETLARGDLGVRLRSLHLEDEGARVTLTRS
jgi:hypothetical protein